MYRLEAVARDKGKAILYYDEQDHILYDHNKNIININRNNQNYDQDDNNQPYSLRLALGHKCNFKCKYCHQDVQVKQTPFAGTAFVDRLIELTNGHISSIQFWGGEPLVYLEEIKEIYNAFEKYEQYRHNFHYGFSTNGLRLKDKEVQDFIYQILYDKLRQRYGDLSKEELDKRSKENFNRGFGFSLSYDGHGQHLRGIDVLKDPDILIFIKDIWEIHPGIISINPVMTKCNYNLIEYLEQMTELLGFTPELNECVPLVISSESGKEQVMTREQLGIYRRSVIQGLVTGKLDNWGVSRESTIRLLKSLNNPDKPSIATGPRCFADSKDTIPIDTEGNVFPCQSFNKYSVDENGDSIIRGNIFNIKSLDEIKSLEFKRLTERQSTMCKRCFVRHICKGGCPYMPKKYEQDNCLYLYNLHVTTFVSMLYRLTGLVLLNFEQI